MVDVRGGDEFGACVLSPSLKSSQRIDARCNSIQMPPTAFDRRPDDALVRSELSGRAGCDSSVGFANERIGKARSQQFHADFRGPALKVALSSQMRQSQFFFRLQLIECPVASSLLQRVSPLIHLNSPTRSDESSSCSCLSRSSAPNYA